MRMHEWGITHLNLCYIDLVEKLGDGFKMEFINPPHSTDCSGCHNLMWFLEIDHVHNLANSKLPHPNIHDIQYVQ